VKANSFHCRPPQHRGSPRPHQCGEFEGTAEYIANKLQTEVYKASARKLEAELKAKATGQQRL